MNFSVKINGQDYQFEKDYTILQACEIIGVEIPRFCYHEKLEIAGNCRMCLVTVKGAPKPVASCATNIANNMEITTNNEATKKAREGVMELLLINHPLDCPVCDQGGECDLQDQAMIYGKGSSEFHEEKRVVKEKNLGPLIKTAMTRCIHCMRCVRFMHDIAGVPELNSMYRGEKSEIVNAISGGLNSELSGNIIDLCPVGALTNRSYSFKARPWELKRTNSIDIMDSLCSNVQIHSRGTEVLRVVPRRNDDLNDEWISDKSRFAFDGLISNRIMSPALKVTDENNNSKFINITWDRAFSILKERIFNSNPKKSAVYSGKFSDCEAIFALKKLCDKLNVTNLYSNSVAKFLPKQKNTIFNSKIAGIDEADFYLIIGCNIRLASPVLNARIRTNIANKNTPTYIIGGNYDLTYPTRHLGEDVSVLSDILNDNCSDDELLTKLRDAKKPMMIVGEEAFGHGADLSKYLQLSLNKLAEKYNFVTDDWNGINILHNYTGSVNGLLMDFWCKNSEENELDFLFLLGEDDLDFSKVKANFIVYQGHHGDKGARNADLVLPGLAYTEKNATYINCEGRAQEGHKITNFPGDAKNDWQIIHELASHLNVHLPFANFDDLRSQMFDHLAIENHGDHFASKNCNKSKFFDLDGEIDDNFSFKLQKSDYHFYDGDVISRNSKTMKAIIASLSKLTTPANQN